MIILDINVARDLPVFLLDSTDHVTPKTGIAEGSVTVKISKNMGALGAFTITGKWTELGQGLYKIAFAAGDLDTRGFFGYLVTATGCDQFSGMQYVGNLPQDIWDKLTSALTTPNSIGKLMVDDINAAISSRSSHSAADVWAVGTRTLTSFGTLVSDIWNNATRTLTSFGTLVSDIWSYTTRTLTSFGTLVADIWNYATRRVSDATNITSDAGTIDQTKIAHLDADITSRAAPGAQMALTPAEETAIQGKILSDATPFAGADIATIKGKTNLIPADIATQLDTNIPGIKAKTDNLPGDPASESEIVGAVAAVDVDVLTRAAPGDQMALTPAEETAMQGKILNDATPFPGANVNAKVGDVKAKTDNLPANPASQTNLDVAVSSRAAPGAQMALTAAEETAIQSKILSDATPFAGANISIIKGVTDKFLFDASNFVLALAENPELGHLNADISTVILAVEDLITRAKGLDNIFDSVALRALEATLTAIKGVGWTDETLKAIKDAIVAGVDPQAIRDAMKLTPSVGSPADGSVDKHLDDIRSSVSKLESGEEPPPKVEYKV